MTLVKLLACGLFLVAGSIQLVSSFTRPHRRLSSAMLLCFAVALCLTLDPVFFAVDQAARVPNLAELVSHLTGLAGIGLMTYLLLDVDGRPRRVRRREALALGAVLVATCVAFALTEAPHEAPAFAATYGRQPSVIAFWAISAGYALVCLLRLATTVRRATPDGTRRDVVAGMRLAALGGGAFGAVYIVLKCVELALSDVDEAGSLGLDSWEQFALVPGMVCLAVGLGLPLMLRAAADLVEQVRCRSALVRLRPLRTQLQELSLVVDDGTSLSSEGSIFADMFGSRARARLLRRVVEVRDALLQIPCDESPGSAISTAAKRGLDLAAEAERLMSMGRIRFSSAVRGAS